MFTESDVSQGPVSDADYIKSLLLYGYVCFCQILSAYLNLNRGAVPFDIDRTVLFNDHRLDAFAFKLVA